MLFFRFLLFYLIFFWFFNFNNKVKRLNIIRKVMHFDLLKFRKVYSRFIDYKLYKSSNIKWFLNFINLKSTYLKNLYRRNIYPLKALNVFLFDKQKFINILKSGLFIQHSLMTDNFNFRFLFLLLDDNLNNIFKNFFRKMKFSFISDSWFPGTLTNLSMLKRFLFFIKFIRNKIYGNNSKVHYISNYQTVQFRRLMLYFYDLRFLFNKLPSFSFFSIKDTLHYPLIFEFLKKRLLSFGLSSFNFYTYTIFGNNYSKIFKFIFQLLCFFNSISSFENIRFDFKINNYKSIFLKKFKFLFIKFSEYPLVKKINNLFLINFMLCLFFSKSLLFLLEKFVKNKFSYYLFQKISLENFPFRYIFLNNFLNNYFLLFFRFLQLIFLYFIFCWLYFLPSYWPIVRVRKMVSLRKSSFFVFNDKKIFGSTKFREMLRQQTEYRKIGLSVCHIKRMWMNGGMFFFMLPFLKVDFYLSFKTYDEYFNVVKIGQIRDFYFSNRLIMNQGKIKYYFNYFKKRFKPRLNLWDSGLVMQEKESDYYDTNQDPFTPKTADDYALELLEELFPSKEKFWLRFYEACDYEDKMLRKRLYKKKVFEKWEIKENYKIVSEMFVWSRWILYEEEMKKSKNKRNLNKLKEIKKCIKLEGNWEDYLTLLMDVLLKK